MSDGEVALVQRQFNTTEAKRSKAALGRIIIAMDYDQSGIATTYDEARALTPARRRHWQCLLSAHVDRTAISLMLDFPSSRCAGARIALAAPH
jgi:hypothetical protein